MRARRLLGVVRSTLLGITTAAVTAAAPVVVATLALEREGAVLEPLSAVTPVVLAVVPTAAVVFAAGNAKRLTRFDRAAIRVGYVAGVAVFLLLLLNPLNGGWRDASAYYTLGVADPYGVAYEVGGVRYAPPFFQTIELLRWLSWPAFLFLWTALEMLALALVAGPIAALLLAIPVVAIEGWYSNINLLLALAITWGFRWPALWSVVLLTKITPGVGLIWFVVRREWRNLGIAIGVTLLIAVVSLLVSPGLWMSWIGAITTDVSAEEVADVIPLPLRIALAAIVVAWGGIRDRPWTVPLGALVAMPVLWQATLSVLIALVPLTRRANPARRRRAVDWAVRTPRAPTPR